STEEDVLAFESNAAMQQEMGVHVDIVSPEDAMRLAPGLKVEGVLRASFCGSDGIADPNGVTQGFARAAQSRGATVVRNTEVVDVKVIGDAVESVETTGGSISTRGVVNAAGPHAAEIGLMAGLEIPIVPYRRHIFITEPLSHDAAAPGSRIMVIDFSSTF